MARLRGVIDFTGKIGGLSAYRRKDMDETIVRTKGGASRKKIKTSKSCERVRENNSEWKGCGRTAGILKSALLHVYHLKDNNIVCDFSTIFKRMQQEDDANIRGQRSILISKHRDLLEGFRITQNNPFDSVVRLPLKFEINRETNSAWVQLPNLLPEVNLFIPWQQPVFRFVITLQTIVDSHYNYPKSGANGVGSAPVVYTEWQTTGQPYTGERIELELKSKDKLDDSWTFILAVGLEMGIPISNKVTNTAKYVGSAKILALG
jgi:hypothetical protein